MRIAASLYVAGSRADGVAVFENRLAPGNAPQGQLVPLGQGLPYLYPGVLAVYEHAVAGGHGLERDCDVVTGIKT